jgi:hypothetical protein
MKYAIQMGSGGMIYLQKNSKLRDYNPQANFTDRAKLVPIFEDIGCRMVSETDPYGR